MKTDDLHRVAYVVLAWFRLDVLVLATLVQAAGALLAAGAVRLMAPRLERASAGPISRLHTASVRRVMTAVAASTPWLLLVLLIRFEELVAAREQVQDHLLRAGRKPGTCLGHHPARHRAWCATRVCRA